MELISPGKIVRCLYCGKRFYKLDNSKVIYCSRRCSRRARGSGLNG
ncbi:hypothetical protein KLL39_04040 [Clostridioides difficile]|nr:hypothetical protein [Clostridioides difficile]MDN9434594.1 hypothetical protein [Clostridioides difficile]